VRSKREGERVCVSAIEVMAGQLENLWCDSDLPIPRIAPRDVLHHVFKF